MTSLIDPKPFEERFRRGEITQAELDQSAPHSRLASPAARQRHNQNMSDMRNRQLGLDMSPAAQAARAERRRVMSSTFNRTNMFGGGFGNPYMQRPMFGGGFGGGFNPYQQRPMFGGGFGGGFNPYQQRPMFNPYQQQSMGFGFPQPQPRFNPFGGGFSRGFNPFRQNLAPSGLFNPQRLGMLGQNFRQQNPGFQNPMSDAARRQSLIAAMNARAQQQGQAQQAQQVPVRGEEMVNTAGSDPRVTAARAMNQARFMAPQGLGGTAQFQNPTVNAGAADAARAAATAQFSGIPQGLGGTAQFQNQAANQMQTGINAGAADAARAAATAQFSGIPQGLGGTAQFQNQAANQMQTGINAGAADAARAAATAQFSGNPMLQAGNAATVPINVPMMNTGAGGGIVPQFGFNPMSQQGAGGTAQFQNQGAGGTNQPAAGGTV